MTYLYTALLQYEKKSLGKSFQVTRRDSSSTPFFVENMAIAL